MTKSGGYTRGHFEDDRHALYMGWVAMRAQIAGLDVSIDVDEDGFYTNRLVIKLPPYDGPLTDHKAAFELRVHVPAPPEGWTLDD